VYIGYRRSIIATTVYNAQIHDLLNGRQLVTRAVYCRDREDQERYITRLSDVHNPGSCCSATKDTCAGYRVYPIIAIDMDAGYSWSGIADASAASYRTVCQDKGFGWCYAGADGERLRGRHTWCLDIHNAGRCCGATKDRCACNCVLPMTVDCMDTGYNWSGIADAGAASYRSVRQDKGCGWGYARTDGERLRGRYTWCLDVHNPGRSC